MSDPAVTRAAHLRRLGGPRGARSRIVLVVATGVASVLDPVEAVAEQDAIGDERGQLRTASAALAHGARSG